MKQKDYKTMTPQEQLDWLTDFQHWTDEKLPVLCALGNAWEASAIKSMEDGLKLISAFGYCRDFVDKSLMFRDFSRRIERMRFYVEKIKKEVAVGASVRGADGSTLAYVPQVQTRRRGRPTKAEVEQRIKNAQAVAKSAPTAEEQPKIATPVEAKPQPLSLFDNVEEKQPEAKPVSNFASAVALSQGEARLHLDQLAWLMSRDLQLEIKTIAGLRATAAKEAEQAKELADHGCPASVIEPHSKAAVEATQTYKAIYDRVDMQLAELYSLLTIGGEHMPLYEKMCAERGISIEQLKGILCPYWEKMGRPTVQLISVTEGLPEETEEEKKARQAKMHSIRTYFMRKDCKLTQKRIDKMKEMLEEVRAYGYPTEEYEAVLSASIKELEEKSKEE